MLQASCEICLQVHAIDDKSTLAKVMAWCPQATGHHYLLTKIYAMCWRRLAAVTYDIYEQVSVEGTHTYTK